MNPETTKPSKRHNLESEDRDELLTAYRTIAFCARETSNFAIRSALESAQEEMKKDLNILGI